jgi:hypothetical protein
MLRHLIALSVLCMCLAACGDDDSPQASPPTATASATATTTATTTATATPTASATVSATATRTATASASPTGTPPAETCATPEVHEREPLCVLDDAPPICDVLVAAKCLLPYPSSFFLRPDPSTPTGYRLAYDIMAMPANKDGVHVDPSEWNTLDGFSPGPLIQAFFPAGVDLAASNLAPIDARALARARQPDRHRRRRERRTHRPLR